MPDWVRKNSIVWDRRFPAHTSGLAAGHEPGRPACTPQPNTFESPFPAPEDCGGRLSCPVPHLRFHMPVRLNPRLLRPYLWRLLTPELLSLPGICRFSRCGRDEHWGCCCRSAGCGTATSDSLLCKPCLVALSGLRAHATVCHWPAIPRLQLAARGNQVPWHGGRFGPMLSWKQCKVHSQG